MNTYDFNKKTNCWNLFISILISEGIGLISGFIIMGYIRKLDYLIKPQFYPPPYLFPLIWSILYLLMGIASYRVWLTGISNNNVQAALVYYAAQLILNFIWPIIFFRLGLIGPAFVELLILLAFVVITTLKFYKIDKIAGLILIPYIIWLIFAAYLNVSLYMLNI